jgi:hypothetical protein
MVVSARFTTELSLKIIQLEFCQWLATCAGRKDLKTLLNVSGIEQTSMLKNENSLKTNMHVIHLFPYIFMSSFFVFGKSRRHKSHFDFGVSIL